MLRSIVLSEDLQKSLKEDELTESTISVNKKVARYILGVMKLAPKWSQFETKNAQLMRRLGVKPDMVSGTVDALEKIARMPGEEEKPEGFEEI